MIRFIFNFLGDIFSNRKNNIVFISNRVIIISTRGEKLMEIGSFKINQFKDQDSFFDNYQEYSLVKTKNELKVYFEAIDQKIFNSL